MQSETYKLVRQCAVTLEQMGAWIDKVNANAASRKYDPNVLLQARLSPDMFPLVRQYASACDNLKLMAARLSGKAAPVHTDDQTSWDQIKARIDDVLAYLNGLTEADFAAAESKKATFPWYPGKSLSARAYLYQFALPNFHFHACMAYAILRHNGVDLGKGDFLGGLPWETV